MKLDVSNGLVIAIGASAGGLQSLRSIVGEISPQSPYLYVIAHHLAPHQPTRLAEILANSTSLSVAYACDGDTIKGARILICPPGSDILVEQDRIQLRPSLPGASIAPSIDRLFSSLAQSAGKNAVGIVLSGSGQDGLQGARDIAAQGGIVFAQSPEQAVHPSMPEAVIQADLADLIGDTQQIGQWLNQLDQLNFEKPVADGQSDQLFAEIFRRVTELTDLDLSQYKEPTLRRQVIRRYRNLNVSCLAEYLERLRADDSEVQALYQSFMISVTAFFRDPEVYAALSEALHGCLAKRQDGDSFRVWVPGCATGQEAYSLAILLAEVMRGRLPRLDIRIFATDIDQRALERARAGIFSKDDLSQIDPVRRDRWFSACTGGWRVSKQIRDMVVFSIHDLTTNPPFIRMDLISCRNLLIYLKSEQQAELIRTFHYGLAPEGILVLGRSESVGFGSNLFIPVDTDTRIFRRNSAATAYPTRQIRFRSPRPGQIANLPRSQINPHRQSQIEAAINTLATHYAPPAVLVNGNFEPVRFFGGAQRYFSLAEDNPEFTVFSLCLPTLRSELKALCYRLIQEDAKYLQGGQVPLAVDGLPSHVRPVLRRVDPQESESELSLLICFEECIGALAISNEEEDEIPVARNEVDQLRRELADTREHLQAVIEELETSNEELQSLNEEVQSSSEELQASNEELQSSNEELTTLNDELRVKSQETIVLNTTLANIQNSLRSSLVVVDMDGKISRFNNLASRIFGIVPGDIGQSLFGVPCHLKLPDLRELLQQVVRQETSIKERVDQGDFHYLMQIDPYKNETNDIAGAVLTFSDISELHRAESANLALERRFRQVWESSLEGMAVVDRSGRIVMTNPALSSMFGYAPDALLGQLIELLVPEGERAVHQGQRDAFLSFPSARRMARMRDVRGRHQNGKEFFIEVSLSGMNLEGENLVLALVSDISARKAAELALRQSEEQLRLALSAAKAGVWRWEMATNLNTWSANLHELYGIDDHRIAPSYDAWLGSVAPEHRETVARAVSEAAAHGSEFDVEWQVNMPEGAEARWLLARGIPTLGADGQPTQYNGIVLDITARKQTEAALLDREFKLSAIIGHSPSALSLKTPEGIYALANPNLQQIHHLTEKEIVGRSDHDLYPEEIARSFRENDQLVLKTMGRHAIEELVPVDGQLRNYISHLFPIVDMAGAVKYICRISLDITDKKRAEAELLRYRDHLEQLVEQRTQELAEAKIVAESATIAKSAFLANMSHEIRTPLNAIMGMSHLIRQSGLSADQGKRFDKLQASADHLLDVINSILDLSKIEANKFELEEAPVSIDRIVSNCLTMLLERAQAKRIALLADIGEIPAGLQGDATRLQQALLNYAANAVRFTDRGSVTIRVQAEAIADDEARLRFSVTDTGIGVEPEALKRLFAAFEQADNTMTRKYGGTGLGLAITKRLAILMGGEAGAESIPGQGSTFWFTARLHRTQQEAIETYPGSETDIEATLRQDYAGCRILLAEDEVINQEVVSEILTDVGLVIEIASDGAEAVRRASASRYDLILMDMQMPILNGIDATRQIRLLPSGKDVPIIALTANVFREDRLRCQEAGMNDFLTKPLLPEKLFAILLHWLSRQRMTDQG